MSTPEGVDLPVVAYSCGRAIADHAAALSRIRSLQAEVEALRASVQSPPDGSGVNEHVSILMRWIDAYAGDYAAEGKLAVTRRVVERALRSLRQRLDDVEQASREGWRHAKECDDARVAAEQEVEMLREALVRARGCIQEDRQVLWDCHVNQDSGRVTDPHGSEGIAEYYAVLRNIDDALRSTVAPGGQPSEQTK
jgi:hypothetical protein